MKKELLQEFQLQAGGSHYPSINPAMQATFAELIIRECINKANDEAERYLSFENFEHRDLCVKVLQNYQLLLKEHFEIE